MLKVITSKFLVLNTYMKYKFRMKELGKKSVVYRPMRLVNPKSISLGDHVRIYKGSRIEGIKSWGNIKYSPRIEIGNNTSIEQFLHLICANKVIIGENVVISANVMIMDNNHSYQKININVMKQPLEVSETIIGDFSFIGMGSKIMPGAKIGKNCIVGSNSIVVGEIPDYSVVVGAPSKIIKRYNFDSSSWQRTDEKGEFINE